MSYSLKNHPFAVEAFFKNSLVLTFAVPKADLEKEIPSCLSLDVFADKYAFVAVALVETQNLRPKGFPAFLGNNFFLIGYRIFVRYKNKAGKNLRGLYILKSETNKKLMQLMGNTFTHYQYTTTDIKQRESASLLDISSLKSDFNFQVNLKAESPNLPTESVFENWKEARRFAGPLPFTFTYNEKEKEVLIIEGVRQNWTPKPIEVVEHSFSFLKNSGFSRAKLANAFIVENIPYYWKKGKIEQWK